MYRDYSITVKQIYNDQRSTELNGGYILLDDLHHDLRRNKLLFL